MAEILRPYQHQGIEAIFTAWRNGIRSVLFQMPTGTGKTVLFSEIVKKGHDHERKVLIVVHRKELIEQIEGKLRGKGVEAGIILAGVEADYSKIIQVASIQTLNRRKHPQANLIIIDECHHAKAASYKKLWEIYPDAKFLGVTATPIRLSGEGFDDLFDVLVPSMQTKQFIRQGYLAPIKHFVGATPDLKTVKKRRGDYVTELLGKVMLDNTLMVNLIESYQKYALNKSAIVFAVNVEHSKTVAERYNQNGISAAHIDGTTPREERKNLLEQFKSKKIKVLSNVEIITEGFDFPECEAVQLARPTKSLALYLQMVGRVMRIAKGKKFGLVLDNAGLWLEHGLPIIDREWTLQGLEKRSRPQFPPKKMIGLTRDGRLKEIFREAPEESEGLELIEITPELERLLVFENFVQLAKLKNQKLISAYFRYRDHLQSDNILLSPIELRYIKKRLNKLNLAAPEDKRFKPGFWYIVERDLKPNVSR
ncbi:DEAD/DEAH box helicase [bacterium]|nr:DEAD/DEAH box helicase [bacterium]